MPRAAISKPRKSKMPTVIPVSENENSVVEVSQPEPINEIVEHVEKLWNTNNHLRTFLHCRRITSLKGSLFLSSREVA